MIKLYEMAAAAVIVFYGWVYGLTEDLYFLFYGEE